MLNNTKLNPDEQKRRARLLKVAFLLLGLFVAGIALDIFVWSSSLSSLQSMLLEILAAVCWIVGIILVIILISRPSKERIIRSQIQQQDAKQRLKIFLPLNILLLVVYTLVCSFIHSTYLIVLVIVVATIAIYSIGILIQRKQQSQQMDSINDLNTPNQWMGNQMNPPNKKISSQLIWKIVWIIVAIFALLWIVTIVMSYYES